MMLPRFLQYLTVLSVAIFLTGCALPKVEQQTISSALTPEQSRQTLLGKTIQPQAQKRPALTGINALANPHDAFAARALLTEVAEKTLDIQYYIWRNDITGILLLQALHQAADRGVRVRLLLDDNGTRKLDDELRALADHPNIEVRLFNPFIQRNAKWLGFITDFSRANRRMHNKAFIADNQVAIVGGRNIGDEYFGATESLLFADLDVVAIGQIVPQVSADFDLYWSSPAVYPIEAMISPQTESLTRLSIKAAAIEQSPAALNYIQAISESDLIRNLINRELTFDWSPVSMLSDNPVKGLGQATPESLIGFQLEKIIGQPQRQLSLISPYFVPTKAISQAFIELVKQGVQVCILTNSLDATDVVAVHAGYAKYRQELVAGGVKLFEMRRQHNSRSKPHKIGVLGSSATSLHAKTFALDSQQVFVGSFNFDPRSTNLNTELGFVIDSTQLAKVIEHSFEHDIPFGAYEVKLDSQGSLIWIERHEENQVIIHPHEPAAGLWRRGQSWFLSILPIDWLL